MARLRHAASGVTYYLEHESLLGRAHAATVWSDSPSVSLHHAALRWADSGRWEIEDLNSRNGTFVDGQRLLPGAITALTLGASVALGTLENRFDFDDSSGPTVMLLPLRGGEPRWPLEEKILALPDAETATHTIFSHPSGLWLLEGPNETRPLQHGDIVVVNEVRWRFSCPKTVGRTATVPSGQLVDGQLAAQGGPASNLGYARDLRVMLKVSSDEETVQLCLRGAGQTRELDYRACFYLLLTLARCRLQRGLPKSIPVDAQGWIEAGRLGEMLRRSEQHLNIDVFRVRRICADLGVLDASNIIERRGPPRRLRLGTEHVSISPL